MKKSLVFLLSICSLILLSACGGGVPPPSITTTEAQLMAVPATVGNSFSFVFQATGGSAGGPFAWKAMGLPANGLSLDPGSGIVSGTPTSKASVAFSLKLTDGADRSSASTPFTISVNNPPPPAITTTQAQVTAGPAVIEYPYTFVFAASGGLAPLSWSESGALPSNMTFSTGGALSGTATATGSFPITVVVQDALGQKAAPQNFTINVIIPPPPIISTTLPPTSGVVNRPYSFTFTATGGFPPLAWTESGELPSGLALSTAGVLSGTPTVVGSSTFTLMVQDSHNRTGTPHDFTIQVSLGFFPTGSMESPRISHTATLLKTDSVLVAGGQSDVGIGTTLGTAELYNQETGMFTFTGSLNVPRTEQVAILLSDSTVLVVGGLDVNGNALPSAEIYDPGTGKFSSTGDMEGPRVGHAAALLADGSVLVVGGQDAVNGNVLSTAEIYNPGTGKFSSINAMNDPRAGLTATLLKTGKVLVAGGKNSTGDLTTAELFDSSNQSFTLTTENMTDQLAGHTATLLNDGRVLLVGPDGSAEVFDPTNGMGTFTAIGGQSDGTGFVAATATLRTDGTVLLAGGQYPYTTICTLPGVPPIPKQFKGTKSSLSAGLFDPGTDSFLQTGNMSQLRSKHTATLLANGRVLVTGGIAFTVGYSRYHGCVQLESVTPSAELFP